MKRGKATKRDILEYRKAQGKELGVGHLDQWGLDEDGKETNIVEVNYLLDLGIPDELTNITIKFPMDYLQKWQNIPEDKFEDLMLMSTASIETMKFDPEDDEQAHL